MTDGKKISKQIQILESNIQLDTLQFFAVTKNNNRYCNKKN
jgi:hypothetical protein